MNFRRSLFIAVCAVAGTTWVDSAMAVPAFARANNVSCGACHTAFPALNQTGRDFKTNGYRLIPVSEGTGSSDFTDSLKDFPISAALISRPYTKDKGENSEIRAIHEAELFIGGVLFQKVSGFVEIESEGEDGFGDVLGTAAINYDLLDELHVQIAYAPTFFADPYDTLSDGRKLTAAHYGLLNSIHGGADNGDKLRHSRQQVSLFGRIAGGRLFYNVGVGGLTGDNVANESRVAFGRLAFEITPGIMVGAYGVDGSCEQDTASDFADCGGAEQDLDFTRAGFDTQIDFGMFRLAGVFMRADDDLIGGGSETNDSGYVQLTYFGMAQDHSVVPLLRFETEEINDGADDISRLTGGVSYYFQDNFKGSIEYGKDTSVPSGFEKESNFTLQLQLVF